MGKQLRAAGFGGRLREWRGKAKLSQGRVAKLLDVSVQQVSRWECGANTPGLERCEEIANKLGLSPSWLAFGEGAP